MPVSKPIIQEIGTMKIEDGELFSFSFKNNIVHITTWTSQTQDKKRFGESIEFDIDNNEELRQTLITLVKGLNI